MRRYRRKSRGRWFPLITPALGTTLFSQTAAAAGSWQVATDTIPLIVNSLDISNVSGTGGETLAAVVGGGSSYLIKRIVGDIHVDMYQGVASDSHCLCFAGIFTDRVTENGVLANASAWIPFAGAGDTAADKLSAQGSQLKRWLWRRTWHLGNPAPIGVMGSTVDNITPPYGNGWSSKAASTLDSKSKARVTWEERLFMMFAVIGLSPNAATSFTTAAAHFLPNLRMFATPTWGDNR